MEENIIQPEELEMFIHNVREFKVEDIGGDRWLTSHEALLKLNQQAVLEASSCREEIVKELFVMHDKLHVLVHEMYCILVWRTKVLPKLLKIEMNPNVTFIFYTILYHEAIAVSLMELVLYHENGCAALGDCALDLIDYCAQAITQLVGLAHLKHDEVPARELSQETFIDELERQKRGILYKIGIRFLSIVSYAAEKIDVMSISVIRRLVQTHDMPCLLSEILHCQPWIRNLDGIEKFIDDKWTPVHGAEVIKVTKIEAQTWFCLSHLLLNNNVMSMYEVTEFRQREISKCQMYLSVNLLDQLPHLTNLKHRLCTLGLTETTNRSNRIILEEVPKIKSVIVDEAKRMGFNQIAQKQFKNFSDLNKEDLMSIAQRLIGVYDIDLMDNECSSHPREPAASMNKCGECGQEAIKKCSHCQQIFYCSRNCQVKHWPQHKPSCQRVQSNH